MLDESFVWLGVFVNFIGGAWYASVTLRAQAQPNPVSWGLWSLTGWIAVGGQLAEGVGIEVLLTVAVAAVPTMIAVVSLAARLIGKRDTYEPITRLDLACAGLSIITLIAWWLTASGLVAIALSIAVDALPAVPVALQAIRSPGSDHPSIWIAGAISATVTLLTLDDFRFASSAFAVYFLILCASMTFLLLGLPTLRRILFPRRAEPTGSAASSPVSAATAAAFGGAFAADYLSWDETDPGRRGYALSAYFDHIPLEVLVRLGWSGAGRQRVEFVLVGDVIADGRTRTVAVDLRIRFTPYVYGGSGKPRPQIADPIVLEAERTVAGHPASAPAADIIGWIPLSSRWTRMRVVVEDHGDRLTIASIPPGNVVVHTDSFPVVSEVHAAGNDDFPSLVGPSLRGIGLGGRK